MWEELRISGGTAIIILISLYFIIKWSVKNGVKEAYRDIRGRKLPEDEAWMFSFKKLNRMIQILKSDLEG